MSKKSVPFRYCPCGKRGFVAERDADKALGRAKAQRGGERGTKRENRYYPCDQSDYYHLTAESRRTYEQVIR